MNHIMIKNLGPIKSINIELNEFNIFIGPQGCGKSTILKVVAYCHWLEKNICTTLDITYYSTHGRFLNLLKSFHRFDDNYFSKDTVIEFIGKYIKIEYNFAHKSSARIQWNKNNNLKDYENSKITYIPSERNIVGSVENIQKYKDRSDNILNFIHEYNDFSKNYTQTSQLNIDVLNIKYHYNKLAKEKDFITLNDSNIKLSLSKTSSGFISAIPLFIFVEFLTEDFFVFQKSKSSLEKDAIEKQIQTKITELQKNNTITTSDVIELVQYLNSPNCKYSQFFIEEPEQNLYPQTQRDLVYYLLKRLHFNDRKNKMFITTHSPYILYAINNSMLGYLVKDKIIQSDGFNNSISKNISFINPKEVSIWEIAEGKVRLIQNEDGLIGKNYFDQLMKGLMDEFYELLNFYEKEGE